MKRLAIIGAGDLGQQIAHYLVDDNHFEVVGFYDDFQKERLNIKGIPILGRIENVLSAYQAGIFDALLLAIGYKHMAFREEIFNMFKGKVPFGSFVHKTCIIDPSSKIGQGSVLYPGCILDQHAVLKENVLLNIGCCIAHDTIIGDHCFLSPRVAIAGFVNVQKCCILGVNSTVIDNITIAANVQIGGGAVVIKNIEKKGLYVGNPIRFIR